MAGSPFQQSLSQSLAQFDQRLRDLGVNPEPYTLPEPPRPDDALVDTVIRHESGGNPNAVSPAGAVGLMQIMPDTARDPGFGVRPVDPARLTDPDLNRNFGTAYLNAMRDRYGGDIEAALAAYNAGPGVADRYVAAGKDPSVLPRETQDYVTGIMRDLASGQTRIEPAGETLSEPRSRSSALQAAIERSEARFAEMRRQMGFGQEPATEPPKPQETAPGQPSLTDFLTEGAMPFSDAPLMDATRFTPDGAVTQAGPGFDADLISQAAAEEALERLQTDPKASLAPAEQREWAIGEFKSARNALVEARKALHLWDNDPDYRDNTIRGLGFKDPQAGARIRSGLARDLAAAQEQWDTVQKRLKGELPLARQTYIENLRQRVLHGASAAGESALEAVRGTSEALTYVDPTLALRGLVTGQDEAARSRSILESLPNPLSPVTEGITTDPARAGDFSSKVAEGAGSMGVFLGTGLAGRMLGLSTAAQTMLTAGMGALVQGGEGMSEADKEGITAAQKFASLFGNMALGTSEALPIARLFHRLDAASGGTVRRVLASTVAGTLEEALQEIGQAVGQNIIARVVGTSPDRDILTGAAEGGAVGGVLGGLVNLLLQGAAGGRRALSRSPEATKETDDGAVRDQPPVPEQDEELPVPEEGAAPVDAGEGLEPSPGGEVAGEGGAPGFADEGLEPSREEGIGPVDAGPLEPGPEGPDEDVDAGPDIEPEPEPGPDDATEPAPTLEPEGEDDGTVRATEAEAEAEAETGQARQVAPPPDAPAGLQAFLPEDLETDARTFQYKSGGDEHGVTNRLRNVKRWDQSSAGIIMVWERRDGKRFVVNGHQRVGLAKRVKAADPSQNPILYGEVFREADGYTAADMRVKAALVNIREGSGTAIDAAKIFREAPQFIDESLPATEATVKHGLPLSKLSDEAFGMVVNELVKPNHAAIVGRLAPDRPEIHVAALQALVEDKPASEVEAESIVRDVLSAPEVTQTQETLFGTDEVVQPLRKERAKIIRGALNRLKKDRAAFGTVIRERARLEAEGNVLAVTANEKREAEDAIIIETVQRLARRTGPVADALNRAAKALADGTASHEEAVTGFIEDARRAGPLSLAGSGEDAGAAGTTEAGAQEQDPLISDTLDLLQPGTLAPGAQRELDSIPEEVIDDLTAARGRAGQPAAPSRPEGDEERQQEEAAEPRGTVGHTGDAEGRRARRAGDSGGRGGRQEPERDTAREAATGTEEGAAEQAGSEAEKVAREATEAEPARNEAEEGEVPGFPPGYRFKQDSLGEGQWTVVNPDGNMVGHSFKPTKEEAVEEAERYTRVRAEKLAKIEAKSRVIRAVGAKVLAGETITDDDLAALELPPVARREFLSPVIHEMFGIPRSQTEKAMGRALKRVVTVEEDGGKRATHEGDTRKILANAAKYAAKHGFTAAEPAGTEGNAPATEQGEDEDVARTERFEAGKALTKEERKQVLATLVDVYRAHGLPKELKGVDRNGNERWGYPYSPDLFVKSAITGAMVRYYVTLPDGRIAHPTELFPNYQESDIKAEMARREIEAEQVRDRVKEWTEDSFDTLEEAAKFWDDLSEQNRGPSGISSIHSSKARIPFTRDGKYILISKMHMQYGERIEELQRQGWRRVEPAGPAEPTVATERTEAGEQTVLPGAERIGQGEQAQRKADAPLKPKVPQKAMESGLFGDERNQGDLVDLIRQSKPKKRAMATGAVTLDPDKPYPELQAEAEPRVAHAVQTYRQKMAGKRPRKPPHKMKPIPEAAGSEQDVDVPRLDAIIENLRAALSIELPAIRVPVRMGRLGRSRHGQVLGTWDPFQGVIRFKYWNDFNTIAHEAGHGIDTLYPAIFEGVVDKHSGELIRFGEALYPNADMETHLREGFAIFVQKYLTEMTVPDSRILPGTPSNGMVATFEAQLRQHFPALGENLKAIQEQFTLWQQKSSVARVSEQVVPQSMRRTSLVAAWKEGGIIGAFNNLVARAYTNHVDDAYPMQVALDHLRAVYKEKVGRPLSLKAIEDPYKLMRMARGHFRKAETVLFHGWRMPDETENTGPSLVDVMVKAFGESPEGWTQEAFHDFNVYLVARRGIAEYDRYIAGEIPKPPLLASREDLVQALEDIGAKYGDRFLDAARLVYDYNARMLDFMHVAGFVSDDSHKRLMEKSEYYVPFQRDMADADPGRFGRANPILEHGAYRRFFGSDRAIIYPLDAMMQQTFQAHEMQAKNEVFQSLAHLVRRIGPGAGYIAEMIPDSELKAMKIDGQDTVARLVEEARAQGKSEEEVAIIEAAVNMVSDLDLDQMHYFYQPISPGKEPIIFGYINGKRRALRLADGELGREMVDAFSLLNAQGQSKMVDFLANAGQVLRLGITASPDFMIANPIRDTIQVWLATDVGYKPVLDFLKGMKQELAYDLGNVRAGEFALKQRSFGGVTGGANLNATRNQAERSLKALGKRGIKTGFMRSPKDILKVFEATETGNRVAVFRKAYEAALLEGMSELEALTEASFIARDVHDFNMGGHRQRQANRMMPFMQSALAGISKYFRVISGAGADTSLPALIGAYRKVNAERRKARASIDETGNVTAPARITEQDKILALQAKALLRIASVSFIGAIAASLYFDDEEYKQFDSDIRATNWLFRGPGGVWVRLPKPWEWTAIPMIAERALEYIHANDPAVLKEITSDLIYAFEPPFTFGGVKPMLEVMFNRRIDNWKDLFSGEHRPIWNTYKQGVSPWLRDSAWTSALGEAVGRTLNVSPDTVDHLFNGFMGTWGRYITRFSNFSDRKAPALDPHDWPVVSRFTKAPERGGKAVRQFYDLMGTSGSMTRAVNDLREVNKRFGPKGVLDHVMDLDKNHRRWVVMKLADMPVETRVRHPLERADRIAKAIRKVGENAMDSETLSPMEKRSIKAALDKIKLWEFQNALLLSGTNSQHIGEPYPDIAKWYDTLRAANAETYRTLMRDLSRAHVRPWKSIEAGWPAFSRHLDRLVTSHIRKLERQAGVKQSALPARNVNLNALLNSLDSRAG